MKRIAQDYLREEPQRELIDIRIKTSPFQQCPNPDSQQKNRKICQAKGCLQRGLPNVGYELPEQTLNASDQLTHSMYF